MYDGAEKLSDCDGAQEKKKGGRRHSIRVGNSSANGTPWVGRRGKKEDEEVHEIQGGPGKDWINSVKKHKGRKKRDQGKTRLVESKGSCGQSQKRGSLAPRIGGGNTRKNGLA